MNRKEGCGTGTYRRLFPIVVPKIQEMPAADLIRHDVMAYRGWDL